MIALIGLIVAGFSASALAFTHGHIDQGIAFSWPSAFLAVAVGLLLSLSRDRNSAGDQPA
tara:strand:- start:635 stop:814 length:180 start_codon:yes stop_codon:yes gene_type:complete